jgi:hypothetical protein
MRKRRKEKRGPGQVGRNAACKKVKSGAVSFFGGRSFTRPEK